MGSRSPSAAWTSSTKERFRARETGLDTPAGSTATVIEAFVRAMSVRSIWADGDSTTAFLHVDYTIGAERTDYVLCVVLDREGVIRWVEMEN
jgi:hypothetical protein